jgi:hypothetical protein
VGNQAGLGSATPRGPGRKTSDPPPHTHFGLSGVSFLICEMDTMNQRLRLHHLGIWVSVGVRLPFLLVIWGQLSGSGP